MNFGSHPLGSLPQYLLTMIVQYMRGIPIICHGVSVRRSYIAKTDKIKLQSMVYSSLLTMLSDGVVVVGWVLRTRVRQLVFRSCRRAV
jgi:hypothetical protein